MFFYSLFFFMGFLSFFFVFFMEELSIVWLGMETVSIFVVMFLLFSVFSLDGISLSSFNKGKIIFKYFLIQMLSGVCILVLIFKQIFFFDIFFFKNFFFFFLAIKVSCFPGHSWVVELYSSLNFFEMFVISVIPKIPSLFFIYIFLYDFIVYIFVFSFFSLLISVLGSVNSSNFRHLMSFSAIMNVGWFLLSLLGSFDVFFFVFFIYFLISYVLYTFFNNLSVMSYVSSLNFFLHNEFMLLLSLILFNMISVPLGLVFFFKFYILTYIINFNLIFMFLFFNSLSIFMYIRFLWFNFFSMNIFSGVFYFKFTFGFFLCFFYVFSLFFLCIFF